MVIIIIIIIVIIIIIIVIIIIIIVIIIIIMSKWIHSSFKRIISSLDFAVIAWLIVLAGRKDPAKTNPFFQYFFINLYITRKKILLNIISPAFVVIEKIIIKISKYLLFETAHHRCLTTFSNYLNLNCNPDQLFPGTSLKNGKFIWKRCVHDFEYLAIPDYQSSFFSFFQRITNSYWNDGWVIKVNFVCSLYRFAKKK